MGITPRPKGNSKDIVKNRKTGRVFIKGSDSETAFELTLRMMAHSQWSNGPVEGPVVVDVSVQIEVPPGLKSGTKAKRAAREEWRRRALDGMVAPVRGDRHGPGGRSVVADRGNYLKMIEDALEGVCYVDDGNIVGGDVSKTWVHEGEGGFVVSVTPWAP